jgi:hypothetical protein
VKHVFLSVLIYCFQSSFVLAQGSVVMNDRPFSADRKQDTAVSGPLQRQPGFSQLPERSKELYYWTNLARTNPRLFLDKYVQPFLEQFPEVRSQESRSLVDQLTSMENLGILLPSPMLVLSAADHAEFLAEKGTLSHTGRGGKNFPQRMKELGITDCAGENVFDGQDDALLAIILLLIDRGVPGLGHRKALLNPAFRVAGMGVSYMKGHRLVLAQQFACE